MDGVFYPKVPTTRVEIWVIEELVSEKNLASPKSETWNMQKPKKKTEQETQMVWTLSYNVVLFK